MGALLRGMHYKQPAVTRLAFRLHLFAALSDPRAPALLAACCTQQQNSSCRSALATVHATAGTVYSTCTVQQVHVHVRGHVSKKRQAKRRELSQPKKASPCEWLKEVLQVSEPQKTLFSIAIPYKPPTNSSFCQTSTDLAIPISWSFV